MNELVPLRLGEVVRTFLVARRLSVSFASVLPSIAVERFLDAFWLLVGLGLGLLFVPLPHSLVGTVGVLGVVVLGAGVLFLWIIVGDRQQFENNEQHSRSALVRRIFGYFLRRHSPRK